MADNAVALQVQTPDSFKTIGSMMDIARGAQHLQAGRQVIESQGLDLQKQRQANTERIGLQQWASNPQNFMDDSGNIDVPKITSTVTQIAPMTGSKVIEHFIGLAKAQTDANQAKLSFNNSERSALMGLNGVMGRANIDDPKVVADEYDRFKTQFDKDSPMHKYIDSAKVGLQNLPAGQGVVKKMLVTSSQSLMDPATQQSSLSPTPSLQSTGGQLNETITQPSVGGNQPSITMTGRTQPMTLAPGIVMDAQGQPHYVGGAPKTTGATPWPTKTGVEATSGATGDMTKHFENLNLAASNLPLATALTKTIEGLAPNAYVGVGGDKKMFMSGVLGALGIHPSGDSQTDTNLLHKAMAQLNMSTPAGTDAARILVEAGQPNTKMDPTAIKEAAGTVAGQIRMNAAERNFLQTVRLSNGGAGDIQKYQEGRQKFESVADPRIWQYEDLVSRDPTAARAFIARQPDKKELVRKTKELTQMGLFK